jgi:hypothetical protein
MEGYMHWKDVVAEMLEPKDKLGSVIDCFLAIGEILEQRAKIAEGKYFDLAEYDKAMLHSMFTLGFLPFWSSHGAGLRPLIMQAFAKDKKDMIPFFFAEAMPYALTIAMPLRQHEYPVIRELTIQKFKQENPTPKATGDIRKD